ncbi:TVP38/TMEM64 family protein [Staphylococcus sp. SQ8-PEA]|uniref:TVP38/TMEM64 family membrane protein n=2 Tax=Staphylococcus marylandisciuri TaxID=2981529 RepID=A0ABT2QPR0_9STAP|nr:TVP38/TMEM64 family protein [Staphylococcus marylandisciuri]
MAEAEFQSWFEYFRELGFIGYLFGFLLPFVEAFVPILPLVLFIILNVNTFGLVAGVLISWASTVCGCYVVFLILRSLAHHTFLHKYKNRRSVQRLISFIDRQGVMPIFILMCFPFTPSALVNIVVSLSHIRRHIYLGVLIFSKMIMVAMVGWLGKDITTYFQNPWRLIVVILVFLAVWMIGKYVERHFMHTYKE